MLEGVSGPIGWPGDIEVGGIVNERDWRRGEGEGRRGAAGERAAVGNNSVIRWIGIAAGNGIGASIGQRHASNGQGGRAGTAEG